MVRVLQSWSAALLVAAASCLGGCSGSRQPLTDDRGSEPDREAAVADRRSEKKGEKLMGTLAISTGAFQPHGPIPKKYTGDGADVSPPFTFAGVPGEARSLALICDDPDAPTPQPWVHWIIYNIPADCPGLPEALPRDAELAEPPQARQGRNSWRSDNVGYRGPAPPGGVHHYHFKLYALDAQLDLAPTAADKSALLVAMQGRVLDQTEIVGTYRR